jgi:hypothetical protein
MLNLFLLIIVVVVLRRRHQTLTTTRFVSHQPTHKNIKQLKRNGVMGSWFSRPVNTALTIIPVICSMLVLGVYKFQTQLIYPSSFPPGSRTTVDTPDQYGIPYQDITLETKDGEKIKAFAMLQDPDRLDYVRKTVLMLCPNAGNMGHRLPVADLFYSRMGYNV